MALAISFIKIVLPVLAAPQSVHAVLFRLEQKDQLQRADKIVIISLQSFEFLIREEVESDGRMEHGHVPIRGLVRLFLKL